ncbi:MAG: hypothetical protein J6B89_04095 [Bacilli bacterium]|nr:hypothetical protein [Bacilli bacterium]
MMTNDVIAALNIINELLNNESYFIDNELMDIICYHLNSLYFDFNLRHIIQANLMINADFGYKIIVLRNRLNRLMCNILKINDDDECINKYKNILLPSFSFDDIESGKYSSFFDSLVGLDFKIPSIGAYIPQGFIIYKNYVIISAYLNKTYHKGLNSCLFIINNNGVILKKVELANCPNVHLGGILYDSINNLLWICDRNAYISSYDFNQVIDLEGNFIIEKIRSIDVGGVGTKTVNASYMTYFNRKIYVGTFNSSLSEYGIVKSFDVLSDGTIDLNSVLEFYVSPQVQGLAFVSRDGLDYIVISCSFGRRNDSWIEAFLYSGESRNYASRGVYKNLDGLIGTQKMPAMIEGISVKKVGNRLLLLSIYESMAFQYNYDPNNMPSSVIDYICTNDLDLLLK